MTSEPWHGDRLEQSRARYPDRVGEVVRDGVRTCFEIYGNGEPTVLLMPTWSIVHSRVCKTQIPYLARHFRVVTFDGRGNGRSDRPTHTAGYDEIEFARDALAVMDATASQRGAPVNYLSVPSNGAARAASLIAELI